MQSEGKLFVIEMEKKNTKGNSFVLHVNVATFTMIYLRRIYGPSAHFFPVKGTQILSQNFHPIEFTILLQR